MAIPAEELAQSCQAADNHMGGDNHEERTAVDEWHSYAKRLSALPPDEQGREIAKLSPEQRRALETAQVRSASSMPGPSLRKRKIWPWIVAVGCLPLAIIAGLLAMSIIGRFFTQPTAKAAVETYRRVVDSKSVMDSTGINIHKDNVIKIRAYGQVVTWHVENVSGPEGQRFTCINEGCACTFQEGRFGQLIGRIGETGKIFGIGSFYTARTKEDGVLFLGVNDCNDWNNNTGSYDVVIEISAKQTG